MLKRSEQTGTHAGTPWTTWVVMALLVVLWLAMLLLGGSEPDRRILVSGYAGDRPWLGLAVFVTSLGDWQVLVALTFFGCGLLLLRRQKRLAALLFVLTLAARLAVGIQKTVFARVRPGENDHLVEGETLSFPSGHAANSMIVYLLLALFLVRNEGARRMAVIAAVALSVLIGVSRVMVAVHWPSDVFGGWAFGLLWVMLVCFARQRWAPAKG